MFNWSSGKDRLAEEEHCDSRRGTYEKPHCGPRRTLQFGYDFFDGKLRTINGRRGFTFLNQTEYERLGSAIDLDIFDMLINEEGMERVEMENEGKTRCYFASPGYKKREKILVLIHGSGVVKAGQWSRSLIINDSLERGSQLPYIRSALGHGWGVVVLNYNEPCGSGCRGGGSATQRLFFNEAANSCSPLRHALAEYAHALPPTVRSSIMLVAHSFGGAVASECSRLEADMGLRRLTTICLTDSYFNGSFGHVANWNTDRRLQGTVEAYPGTVYQLYSGDQTHEGSSAAAIGSIFYVLERVTRRMSTLQFETVLRDAAMKTKRREEADVDPPICGAQPYQQVHHAESAPLHAGGTSPDFQSDKHQRFQQKSQSLHALYPDNSSTNTRPPTRRRAATPERGTADYSELARKSYNGRSMGQQRTKSWPSREQMDWSDTQSSGGDRRPAAIRDRSPGSYRRQSGGGKGVATSTSKAFSRSATFDIFDYGFPGSSRTYHL